MGTVFLVAYLGFILGYPVLQALTLMRCRGRWRAAPLLGLVLAGPF